jgi:hypothetical protein
MIRSTVRAAVPLIALLALAGCEHQKSSNPLSPTIAGPIPGVEITQPKLLEPGQGVKFRDRQQPITLVVENASTNGVRPLRYGFQIATDAGFTNVVFSRQDVAQGGNGRTSLKLQDKLQLGRTYYWRSWAYDGANTGPMAASVSFDVYPPASISAPTLAGPANGSTVTSVAPLLILRNSARSGPVGNVSYGIQVSSNQAFTNIVAGNNGQPEDLRGQTSWVPGGLAPDTTYYWRALASDGETTSAWSSTWSFSTPSPTPVPTPGPAPGGSCSSLAANPQQVVACRRAQYGSRISASQAPSLLRAIAQDLNSGTSSSFYGLLRKTSGNNCGGFACDIVCARNGSNHWDVLVDGPDASAGYAGTASPSWQPKGSISASACVAP